VLWSFAAPRPLVETLSVRACPAEAVCEGRLTNLVR
jgi:hypothetical protein